METMEIDLTQINIRKMTQEIAEAARQSSTEEDFKVPAEHILRKHVLDKFNIPYGKYERGTFISGVRGRSDVLYGHVLIEYEKPGVLNTKKGREDAIEQVRKYIRGYAKFEKALPLYFDIEYVLVKPYLENFVAMPMGIPWLRYVSIRPH